ncbi:hypothetical protein [Amphritea atlantica]|uniref:hypothetical protein n=1 Tax=Amphritea atlantica TaxID=355243 RepID=UPI0011132F64|nr:hypothetical protein [Amphritea atlantica]
MRRELVKEGRFELIVYFDRTLSIGWGWKTSDHYDPLTEVLWHKRTKSLYSPKKRAEIIKSLGKRNAKRLFPKLEEHMEWYEPVFSTAATLVRQYKKVEGLSLESVGFQSESATCN